MRQRPEPEIIPPGREPEVREGASDEQLALLARLMDDVFRIPGTPIRFGMDSVIGLLPGMGDMVTGLVSFTILYSAWARGVPRVTQARMLANIAIDAAIGTIPFLGDVFDIAWKANRKNYELLQRSQYESNRRQEFSDWLFLIGILLATAIVVAIPIAVLIWTVRELRG